MTKLQFKSIITILLIRLYVLLCHSITDSQQTHWNCMTKLQHKSIIIILIIRLYVLLCHSIIDGQQTHWNWMTPTLKFMLSAFKKTPTTPLTQFSMSWKFERLIEPEPSIRKMTSTSVSTSGHPGKIMIF